MLYIITPSNDHCNGFIILCHKKLLNFETNKKFAPNSVCFNCDFKIDGETKTATAAATLTPKYSKYVCSNMAICLCYAII